MRHRDLEPTWSSCLSCGCDDDLPGNEASRVSFVRPLVSVALRDLSWVGSEASVSLTHEFLRRSDRSCVCKKKFLESAVFGV